MITRAKVSSAAEWVSRHAGSMALLIACVGVAGGIIAVRDESSARIRSESRIRVEVTRANAISLVQSLRTSCRDRNVKDGRTLAAIREIARAQSVQPAVFAPLTAALSPRDCNSVFPLPDINGKVAHAATPSTVPFKTCAEARAAGRTPLRLGDPGYNPKLDPDRDGIACE